MESSVCRRSPLRGYHDAGTPNLVVGCGGNLLSLPARHFAQPDSGVRNLLSGGYFLDLVGDSKNGPATQTRTAAWGSRERGDSEIGTSGAADRIDQSGPRIGHACLGRSSDSARSRLGNRVDRLLPVGSLLLTAGLCGFSARIRGASGKGFRPGGSSDTLRMAARNASRNPQRSVLSTALVACACFVIVAVGMFRSNLPQDSLDRTSGTGGFSLVATSDIPLLQDLSDSDARFDLGIPDSNILDAARFFPFRVLPGDDTSCLNLYEPQQPRVLGVPASMVQRGGFSVDTPEPTNAPWRLLDQDLGEGVIPAFGDHESVLWILKLGLGDELEFIDDNGQSLRLRLVGLIQNSIFQSELLISEDRFLKHFPRRTGYQYFLIDSALEQGEELTSQLEDGLSRFGFDVSSTGEKLARYQAVRGTYISTFQTLGGFGLLLGTLGLGVILVRNVCGTAPRTGHSASFRISSSPSGLAGGGRECLSLSSRHPAGRRRRPGGCRSVSSLRRVSAGLPGSHVDRSPGHRNAGLPGRRPSRPPDPYAPGPESGLGTSPLQLAPGRKGRPISWD